MRKPEDVRKDIDSIDERLFGLLAERFALSREMGKIKKESGQPVYSPEREKKIISRLYEICPGYSPYVAAVYDSVFAESRRLQNDMNSGLYGLLGRRLGHSYSAAIHESFGLYHYVMIEKEPEELDAFFAAREFNGINVTVPYKKVAADYCSRLTDAAVATGCVNAIRRERDGSLTGHNTDVDGFRAMLRNNGIALKGSKLVILGSGGAAGMIRSVAEADGVRETVIISRNGENNYGNISDHFDADILINATPVGMFPDNGSCLVDPAEFTGLSFVGDLVYNPAVTELLRRAQSCGIRCSNGLGMLVAQAGAAATFFTGCTIAEETLDDILNNLLISERNIMLTGMPGCGKSTVGALLARKLGREFIDCDEYFEKATGISPENYILTYGEKKFRNTEHEHLSRISALSGKVIATGGGCVTVEDNIRLMRQNSVVVYLTRELDELPMTGRPLSVREGKAALYEQRHGLYLSASDFQVCNNALPDDAVNLILEKLV